MLDQISSGPADLISFVAASWMGLHDRSAGSEKKQSGLAEVMRSDPALHRRGCSALRTGLAQDQCRREWIPDRLELALCSTAQYTAQS